MGQDKKYSSHLEIKGFETIDGEELLHVVGMSESLDRDGELLLLSGADLEPFKKNPVILYQHNSWGLPIGISVRTEIQGKELHLWIKFKANKPEVEEIQEYIKEGILRGISIGFIPRKNRLQTATAEQKEKGYDQIRVITEWELVECSIVTIQSNYEGLVKALGLDLDIKELANNPNTDKINNISNMMTKLLNKLEGGIMPDVNEKAGAVISKANIKSLDIAIKELTKIKDSTIKEDGVQTDDTKTVEEQMIELKETILTEVKGLIEKKSKEEDSEEVIEVEDFLAEREKNKQSNNN